MPSTFQKIATITVGSSGASTIEFTSIPQTFTDISVKINARSASSAGSAWNYIEIRPNGSSANGTFRQIYGTGSSSGGSGSGSILLGAYANDSSATASVFGNSETYIPYYTSNNFKSMSNDSVTENNNGTALANLSATLWSSTAAITSLTLVLGTGNFAEYSVATLYGIKNS